MTDFHYPKVAIPHLSKLAEKNAKAIHSVKDYLVGNVKNGGSLFVFGSGHSSLFPLELYHRAGGASFVIPIVGDFLLPTAGPPIVRVLERQSGVSVTLLKRAEPQKGEMLWIMSQSGINSASVDVALEAKKMGLRTVAFSSVVHSSSVESRHPSGKRLFEVCDEVIDLDGFRGDAAVSINEDAKAGPLSLLGAVLLGHTILVEACTDLEKSGHRCVYTSVNTPEGEKRNKQLEKDAAKRDALLRE